MTAKFVVISRYDTYVIAEGRCSVRLYIVI